jgi:hypothetical protein
MLPSARLFRPPSFGMAALLREHGVLTNLFRAMKCISIDAEIGHRAGTFSAIIKKAMASNSAMPSWPRQL